MDSPDASRRLFLASSSAALTGAWLASNWPGIAAAAQHAEHASSATVPASFSAFSVADAADVEAIAAQILPSGATPGAREARAVYFIDRSLATFFASGADAFRAGLAEFQLAFRRSQSAAAAFAVAGTDAQIAFLGQVDRTPFFESMRVLTILGTLCASKYGGNHAGLGWKLMGFEDQHMFVAPFGDYDRDYAGFVPYAAEKGQ
jgi:gluconate 2-dehydrogenase gamma chain